MIHDTPNVLLESLDDLYTTSLTPSIWRLQSGRNPTMPRASKAEVLSAANAALLISKELLTTAQTFADEVEKIEAQLLVLEENPVLNKAFIRERRETLAWARQQTEDFYQAARQYLKDGKRLARKARWMFG